MKERKRKIKECLATNKMITADQLLEISLQIVFGLIKSLAREDGERR
jgi:hypothetical protein